MHQDFSDDIFGLKNRANIFHNVKSVCLNLRDTLQVVKVIGYNPGLTNSAFNVPGPGPAMETNSTIKKGMPNQHAFHCIISHTDSPMPLLAVSELLLLLMQLYMRYPQE